MVLMRRGKLKKIEKTHNICVRITEKQRFFLEDLADHGGRSVANCIRKLIDDEMNKKKKGSK